MRTVKYSEPGGNKSRGITARARESRATGALYHDNCLHLSRAYDHVCFVCSERLRTMAKVMIFGYILREKKCNPLSLRRGRSLIF